MIFQVVTDDVMQRAAVYAAFTGGLAYALRTAWVIVSYAIAQIIGETSKRTVLDSWRAASIADENRALRNL